MDTSEDSKACSNCKSDLRSLNERVPVVPQQMRYQKIWDKVLNPDEQVEYEFSIGEGYKT